MSKSQPNPPAVPKFTPINVGQAARDVLSANIGAYSWSDADTLARFPGMVRARQSLTEQAYNELTGPLNPAVQQQFTTSALGGASGSLGGGDALSGLGLTQGSAGRNAASVGFANSVLGKQDFDRQTLANLIATNQERQFGIGSGDIATIAALNSQGVNQLGQESYQAQLAQIYGQGQQGVQTGQSIAALGALISRLGNTGGSHG